MRLSWEPEELGWCFGSIIDGKRFARWASPGSGSDGLRGKKRQEEKGKKRCQGKKRCHSYLTPFSCAYGLGNLRGPAAYAITAHIFGAPPLTRSRLTSQFQKATCPAQTWLSAASASNTRHAEELIPVGRCTIHSARRRLCRDRCR